MEMVERLKKRGVFFGMCFGWSLGRGVFSGWGKMLGGRDFSGAVRRRENGLRKRGMVMETLGWWILALAALILVFILYMMISGKGQGAIEYFKTLWRFGS